jgi:hypothetical protein
MSIRNLSFIRKVLLADAVISGTTGVMMTLGTSLLSEFLGLSQPLLFWAGLSLVPFAALAGLVASRPQPTKTGVWTIVVLNIAWVLASVLVLVLGLVTPTIFGTSFIIVQAVVVGVLAELQIIAARRETVLA